MTKYPKPIRIPDHVWHSAPARAALRARDVGAILRLIQQHTGASQHHLATVTGIPQGRLSEIMNGRRTVTALDVFERIADGLRMPDHARVTMGLAPRHWQPSPKGSQGSRETQ